METFSEEVGRKGSLSLAKWPLRTSLVAASDHPSEARPNGHASLTCWSHHRSTPKGLWSDTKKYLRKCDLCTQKWKRFCILLRLRELSFTNRDITKPFCKDKALFVCLLLGPQKGKSASGCVQVNSYCHLFLLHGILLKAHSNWAQELSAVFRRGVPLLDFCEVDSLVDRGYIC